MDVSKVLSVYMAHMEGRKKDFQYCLRLDATLNWFGRKIYGQRNINEYFQQDIWPIYQQNFENAINANRLKFREFI